MEALSVHRGSAFSIAIDGMVNVKGLQYSSKLLSIVGGCYPYHCIPLQDGETPSEALLRVKAMLESNDNSSNYAADRSRPCLADEIYMALAVFQTPAKGASPLFPLQACPQTQHSKLSTFFDDVVDTCVRVAESSGVSFIGISADRADAHRLWDFLIRFVDGDLGFIASQGIRKLNECNVHNRFLFRHESCL
jgi:hypothetical protein